MHNTYEYIHMNICIYIHIYTYIHIYIHIHIQVAKLIILYVQHLAQVTTQPNPLDPPYEHINMYMCFYLYMYIYIYRYYIHIYTCMYMYLHTYISIYTQVAKLIILYVQHLAQITIQPDPPDPPGIPYPYLL
jgi:hypothetical protein